MPVTRQSELRNLEEYENPPLAENIYEREQKAIEYIEVRSWSIRKAAMKAGVERTRLQESLKRGKKIMLQVEKDTCLRKASLIFILK
mmetsp:Transcript_20515/g.28354  ORF Transcript_20515/g.28354 Transcript_20515/m.28354 type:complete len:87 (+) Transcript_20515:132-392(+)